jgi:uncharacterized repeat protein (TIGR01451 family)
MARKMPLAAGWMGWTLALGLAVALDRSSSAQSTTTPETGLFEAIKVKIAWLADRDTFACILGAHATENGLELCGRVPSEAVHQRALGLARNHSALPVVDRLEVNPDMIRRQPTASTAEDLQRDAVALLQQALGEHARMYHVAGAANGAVTITGIARSYEEKLRVSQELRLLNPCACVVNQLVVAAVERDGRAYEPVIAEGNPGVAVLSPSGIATSPYAAVNNPTPPATAAPPAKKTTTAAPPATSVVPAAPTDGRSAITYTLPSSIPLPPPPASSARKLASVPLPPVEAPEMPPFTAKEHAPGAGLRALGAGLLTPPLDAAADSGDPRRAPRAQAKPFAVEANKPPEMPSEGMRTAAFTPSPAPETSIVQAQAGAPASLPISVTAPAATLPQSVAKPAAPKPGFVAESAEIDGWSAWAVGLAISTVLLVLFVPVSLRWLRRDVSAKKQKAPEKEEKEQPRELIVVAARIPEPPLHQMPQIRKETEVRRSPWPIPAASIRPGSGPAPAVVHGSNKASSEPAVTVRWVGPQAARLGQPVACQLLVRNPSSSPVHQVVVRHEPGAGVVVQNTQPPAGRDGAWLTWSLETLLPGQERSIDLQLLPEARGELNCEAQVTFTSSCALRMQIREPKLTLHVTVPDKVMLGQTATVLVVVSNSGDGIADNVKVTARLPQGLEHAGGQNFALDLGNLMAQESRTIQLLCGAKAGGLQRCEIIASADETEAARDLAVLDVLLPQLTLAVTGPKRRYIDRHANYTIRVTNPGSAPASNVTITHQIPRGLSFHAASAGGRHEEANETVCWFIGDLLPGQTGEVTLELVAAAAGTCTHRIKAQAVGGLVAQSEISTLVEGLSALQIEIVNHDDPVEVGADTTYEVRVINAGSKVESVLELTCTLAAGMEFRSATGASGAVHRHEGSEIVFERLRELAPRQEAIYRIQVVGREAGDLRFRAKLTAQGIAEPVLRDKTTKVYGDELAVH